MRLKPFDVSRDWPPLFHELLQSVVKDEPIVVSCTFDSSGEGPFGKGERRGLIRWGRYGRFASSWCGGVIRRLVYCFVEIVTSVCDVENTNFRSSPIDGVQSCSNNGCTYA